ncbi:DNA topoisomerase 3-alpha [Ceratobasidium sp. 395]|nr:DNA topoisomerase 3-alpha [Ceratobasidium sp. 395]
MTRSIEQYKEVFVRARQQFHLIIESVGQHINGQQGAIEGLPVNNRGGGHDGGDRGRGRGRGGGRGGGPGRNNHGQPENGSDPDSDGDGGMGGRGRGRRGAARGPRGGATSPVSRRGRGAKTSSAQSNGGEIQVAHILTRSLNFPIMHPVPQASRRTSVTQPTSNSTRQGVTCQCGEPAAERTVMKDGPNKGRKFFACGKDRTCDFFEWFDGPSGSGAIKAPSVPKPQSVVPAKRTSSIMTVRSQFNNALNSLLTLVVSARRR